MMTVLASALNSTILAGVTLLYLWCPSLTASHKALVTVWMVFISVWFIFCAAMRAVPDLCPGAVLWLQLGVYMVYLVVLTIDTSFFLSLDLLGTVWMLVSWLALMPLVVLHYLALRRPSKLELVELQDDQL